MDDNSTVLNSMSAEITTERIRKALIKNAQLVEKYGDAYLPTFLRLEKEYIKSKQKDEIINRVALYARGEF